MIDYADGELVEITHDGWGGWHRFKFCRLQCGFYAVESAAYVSLIVIVEAKFGYQIRRVAARRNEG